MKEKTRRIIALLCAVCLLASGEGRLCLTALAAMARPASYVVDTAVEDAAVRDEAPGDAEAEPAELAENDMDSESMYYAAAGEDIAADAAAVSAEAEAVVSDVESVDNDSNTVLSNSVLTAEWDIYRVKVTYNENSGIPEDAELVVREVTENNDPNFADYLSVGAGLAGLDTDGISDESVPIAKAFDISLRSKATGEEYQPAKDMKVEISIPHYKLADNMQVSVVHFAEKLSEELQEELRQEAYAGFSDEEREVYDELSDEERDVYIGLSYEEREVYADLSEEERLVYAGLSDEDRAVYVDLSDEEREEHGYVLDDESVDDEELLTVLNSIPQLMEVDLINNTAAFTTDGFSVFVVLGYTVDFHWGEYTFSMEGGTTLLLSELLETLINGVESTNGNSNNDESSDETQAEKSNAQGNGSVEVYMLTQLKEILDNPELIENVEFSNSDLLEVREATVYNGSEEGEIDSEEEDDELMSEDDGSSEEVWLLISKAPFDSNERLTISLTDGRTVEIPVTDERVAGNAATGGRVTVDGVTYTLVNGVGLGSVSTTSNEGDNASYYGRATVYAITKDCTVHNEITYGGNIYKVWNIAANLAARQLTSTGMKMDEKFVNRAAGYVFRLPEMKTDITAEEKAELNAAGFVAGDSNDKTDSTEASDYKFWKKAAYNPDTNSIDYEIKYFQALKENAPLDFIFIYDDSVTMYTGDRGAPTNNGANNYNETVIRETQGTRIMILSAAQALLEDKDGYNIRVALGGASNGDNRKSIDDHGWFNQGTDGYSGVETYLSTYATGVTNHNTGLDNALAMAKSSKNAGRNPIVIYLSDFKDGAYNASTAAQLHSIARTYAMNTTNVGTRVRSRTIASDASTIYTMSEIDDGVKTLEEIILDAIGYFMKDTITVTDELSDAMKDSDTSVGTADIGTVPADKGKSVWTLGGTRDANGRYPGAGTVYSESFSVPLDPDTVYSGTMPTNGKATVVINGEVVNTIEPKEDDPNADPAKLHKGGGVTFVLGELDKSGSLFPISGKEVPTNKITGITFQLYSYENNTKGSQVGSDYTTDSDGAFTVPFIGADSKPILKLGKQYYLEENAGTVSAYNAADPARKLVAPDKGWIVSVAENGVVTAKAESGATQTPEMTIASAIPKTDESASGQSAKLVIWNKIVIPASLIEVTVSKTWVGGTERYSVPFTITGISQSDNSEHVLAAYAEKSTSSAHVIALNKDECEVTNDSGGNEIWSRKVWVPDKLEEVDENNNSVEYVFSTHESLNTNNLPTNKTYYQMVNGVKTKVELASLADVNGYIEYRQTYNYKITEGTTPTYYNGWYVPEETIRIVNDSMQGWNNSIPPGWKNYDGNKSTKYQLHYNNDDLDVSGSGYSRIRDVFSNISTVELEIKNSTKNAEVTDYHLEFTPAAGLSGSGGVIFYGLELPAEWDTYDPVDQATSHYNNANDFGTIKVLSVTKLVLHMKNGNTINVLVDGNGNGTYSQSSGNYQYGLYIERYISTSQNHYNWAAHTTNGPVSNTKTQIPDEGIPETIDENDIIDIKSCLLSITNTWHENPLNEINIVKNWTVEDDETAKLKEAIEHNNSELKLHFYGTLNGQLESMDEYAHMSNDWTSALKTGMTGSSSASSWTDKVYLPKYASKTYDRNDANSPYEYVYDNKSITEEDLNQNIAKDDDGQNKGEWKNPTYVYTPKSLHHDEVRIKEGWYTYTLGPTHRVYFVFEYAGKKNTTTATATGGTSLATRDRFRIEYTVGEHRYRDTLYFAERPFGEKDWEPRKYAIAFDLPISYGLPTITKFEIPKLADPNEYYDVTEFTTDNNKRIVTDNYYLTTFFSGDTGDNGSLVNSTEPKYTIWKDNETIPAYDEDLPDNFTIGNTYIPYKAVKLKSVFTDGSLDASGSDRIQKIVYTIKDENGNVIRTTELPIAIAAGSGETGDKTIFLPKGTYSISQGYVIGTETYVYELDENLDAYNVEYTVKMGENTSDPVKAVSYHAEIASDRELTFKTNRKILPIRVEMDWEPSLTDNEDPIQESGIPLSYKLRYENVDMTGSTEVMGDYTKNVNGATTNQHHPFTLEYARQVNIHDTKTACVPTYSVREMITKCDLDDANMKDALPDYQLNTVSAEKESAGERTMVFTIEARIKRAYVGIEKYFDEEFDYDKFKGAKLTYKIERSDGGNIFGTSTKNVEITMDVPTTGRPDKLTGTMALQSSMTTNYFDGLNQRTKEVYSQNAENGTQIVRENVYLPIIRKAEKEAGIRYILSETISNSAVTVYAPVFTDETGDADSEFTQTNPAGKNIDIIDANGNTVKANKAVFVLNGRGIIIGIGNSERGYICKIVETYGTGENARTVEVPFRTLNRAVTHARVYGNGQEMSASNIVKIEMLVDYVIPSTDKVLLNRSTDNIIITTAATSGGVYNFVKTFTAADGRKAYVAEVKDDEGNIITPESGDRNDVAILKRGYNGRSLFVVDNASASLTTAMITFDGSNKAYGADGKYTTGGTTYTCDTSDGGSGHGGIISVPAGTLNLNEDSTLRNSKAVQGGAVCVKGRLTESGAKLLDNYAVGDGSTPAYGGAVCLESGAEATFRDVYIDGHSTMTIYKAGDVKDGKQLTAEEADAANRADAAAVDVNADRGGGVYISANATLEFHGGELIKLRAATNGGAIDNLGKLTMAEDDQAGSAHADIEGSMEHCSATNGGAIYNGVSGTINMTGGLIHHCIAAENGGGIFTESTAVIAGKDMAIDMHTEGGKPGVISDCEAVNGNGGGIYVKAGKLDMTGGEIRGCKAIAPKNANGKVIVNVDSNTDETTCASGKGGGVYNLGTVILATASDHPGRIDNCSADFAGGGIYTTGSGSMSITGGEMDDNRAGYYGGAIYDDTIRREFDTADLLIQGIIIRGHVSLDKDTVNAQKGGAIYVANGNLDLRDRGSGESAVHTQIYDCTASENGGAIYHIFNQHIHKNSEGGRKTTLTLTDVVIDGHDKLDGSTKNARYGGAIFVFNGCDNGGSHSGHDRFKMPNGNIVKLNQFPGPNIIIDGGKIADCTADVNGGAIYCDSPVEGEGKNTISLQNGTVINGHESLGADIWNANCNDTTPNANQTNLGGGAIYFKRGTLKVGNKEDTEPVKILNCTARNFGGAVFGLPSGTNIDEDGYKYTAKLENCLIDGHAAGTTLAADDVNAGLGGGAVYMKMSTVSIENSILRNLRAPYGAAILGRTNDGGTQACTVTIDGGRIENNIATADKGGAVNAMSGLAIKDAGEDNSVDRAAAGFPVLKETNETKWAVCTFRLEGDAVIYNNFGVGNFASQQKNLVLTRHRAETPTTEVGDTNAIINTTENGLTEDAHIGVYVTGADGMDGSAESEPYELHGGYEDDFGTYIGSANLHKFTNDRNGMYGAVCTLTDGNHTPDKGHNKSEKIIRWESYLCKLTDDSGSLLFITAPGGWAGSRVIDGTTYYPAVFRTLTEAFNAMKGVAADGTSELKLYKADGNEYTIGSDIQLHMLRNYEQPGTDRPLFEADRKLTFTTAKKQANTNTGYSNGDVYIYSKGSFANADDTRATILRGENGTAGDASMLTIPDTAPTGLSLTLRNIIFDGNNYTHAGPGGIINARKGDLTVTTGSILRNAIATDKGGAIEKINGNFIMDGNAQVVNCAAQHGGGVHLEALTKCEIGGSDVIITGSKANNGCGGGIFIHSSPAVFKDKLTISGCHADVKGGGVNIGWGDASLTVEGENVKILNCDAKKEQEGQSSDGGGGLNIETGRNVSFGKLTISGCYTDGKGGAVRLEENATMTMNDGTIEKNKVLAGGEGAGIYVSQGSTLKLSGSPGFGSGSDANTAALDGYSTKNNGLAAYGSDTVRQDIYLAETGAESTTDEKYDPASIIVTGDITSGDSSIWVWAEDQYRYKQLMPFAKMGTGVKFAESPTDSQLDAAHLKAFRNAQDDETTENGTDTYLYGTIEGEKTDAGIIYWTGVTGSRKVILRKVGTTYTSMSGKTFNVFKGTSTLPYVVKQGTKRTQLGGTSTDTTVTVDPMTSQSSGVIWIGNLPYGWYIIEEKNPHKYFYLVVTANGTFGTPQKVTENDVVKEGGYDSLANAQAAAKALYDAKK